LPEFRLIVTSKTALVDGSVQLSEPKIRPLQR